MVSARELKEIMSLTNPVIRKRMPYPLAVDCDSAAVHLKAKAYPAMGHINMPHLKKGEVYAPNYS